MVERLDQAVPTTALLVRFGGLSVDSTVGMEAVIGFLK